MKRSKPLYASRIRRCQNANNTIGTQAVSATVRGSSVDNISITGLLQEELIIGLAIAASLGLISFILALVAFGNAALSLAVGLAVAGGGTISAMVGFGLPWVLKHFGSDPALGSGPICTIIQDVASLSIYFVLVSALILLDRLMRPARFAKSAIAAARRKISGGSVTPGTIFGVWIRSAVSPPHSRQVRHPG